MQSKSNLPLRKIKYDLSIIGTVGLPAYYGGFETLAEQIVLSLSQKRTIQVFCSSKLLKQSHTRLLEFGGAKLSYVALSANGWQSIPYDFISLWRGAKSSSTLLVLGVSGCILLPFLRVIFPDIRIITNIDGVEWRRAKWGAAAKGFIRVSEWFAVKFSNALIADNQGISDYLTQTYGIESHLIAYGGNRRGGDLPVIESKSGDNMPPPNQYYLTICRIEPENHVATILQAFSEIADKSLLIIGNWNVSEYSRSLRVQFSGYSNIYMCDPIYELQPLLKLRTDAIALIHGHSAGGTNPALVEGMFIGMAVFAYDVIYNRYTTNHEAVYWKNANDLIVIIRSIDEKMVDQIAKKMKTYALLNYSWEKITNQYDSIFFE